MQVRGKPHSQELETSPAFNQYLRTYVYTALTSCGQRVLLLLHYPTRDLQKGRSLLQQGVRIFKSSQTTNYYVYDHIMYVQILYIRDVTNNLNIWNIYS